MIYTTIDYFLLIFFVFNLLFAGDVVLDLSVSIFGLLKLVSLDSLFTTGLLLLSYWLIVIHEVRTNNINIVNEYFSIIYFNNLQLKFKYILHEGHPNTNLDENINKLYSNKWLTKIKDVQKKYKIIYELFNT